MAGLFLYVDDRERLLHPALRTTIAHEMLVIKRLERSDLAIGTETKLYALFERKTLADYGASIRDGRTKNKQKMLDVRAATGCHVYYIIEGPLRPSATTEYGGVEYSSIKASITHLMTEYGIMILRTVTKEETAEVMADLMASYAVRPPSDDGAQVNAATDAASAYEVNLGSVVVGRSDEVAMLNVRAQKTQLDRRVELWSSLTGFGTRTALRMAEYKPIEVLSGKAALDLSEAQKLVIVRLLSDRWNKEQEDLLRGIPGIGARRSTALTQQFTCFRDLWKNRERLGVDMRKKVEEAMA
jgi:ERCC4-type nuclease